MVRSPSSGQESTDKYSNSIISQRENTCTFEECHVNVEFVEELLSTEQVIANTSQLSHPHVIVWYMGCYGVRKAGVQFYKDFLITPALKQNKETTFWLVDLMAWGAFKNPKGSIHQANSFCDDIENFSDDRIKCIRSAEILKKIQEISEKDFIDYFKEALHRDFICQSSKGFPNTNITVGEVFLNNCPIMADWYDQDVSKSYSVFQYLEGCLLVDTIFTRLSINELESNVQIVFALPNDELKYYRDQYDSFQKDVKFLISKRCAAFKIKMVNLNIKFLAFRYGSQLQHRPYNAKGKLLKKETLFYEDVVGPFEEMKK